MKGILMFAIRYIDDNSKDYKMQVMSFYDFEYGKISTAEKQWLYVKYKEFEDAIETMKNAYNISPEKLEKLFTFCYSNCDYETTGLLQFKDIHSIEHDWDVIMQSLQESNDYYYNLFEYMDFWLEIITCLCTEDFLKSKDFSKYADGDGVYVGIIEDKTKYYESGSEIESAYDILKDHEPHNLILDIYNIKKVSELIKFSDWE